MKTTNLSLLIGALMFVTNIPTALADNGPKGNFCAYNGYTLNGVIDSSMKATCKILKNTARFYLAPDIVEKVDLISSGDYIEYSSGYGDEIVPKYRAYQIGQDIGGYALFAIPHSVFKKYFSDTSGFGIGAGTNESVLPVTATTKYFDLPDRSNGQTVGNLVGTVYGLVASGLKFAVPSSGKDAYLTVYNSERKNGFFGSNLKLITDATVSIASPVKGYDFSYTISQNKDGLLEVHKDSVVTRLEDGSTKTENFDSSKSATLNVESNTPTTTSVVETSNAQPVSSSWILRLWSWITGFFH